MTLDESQKMVEQALATWVGGKKPAPLTQGQLQFFKDFYTLLLTPATTERVEVAAVTSGWVDVVDSNVKVLFLHHDQGFNHTLTSLEKETTKPISLLVADADYGAGLAVWDQVAWKVEFKQCVEFVLSHNRSLDGVKFAFFLSDKQLKDCFVACEHHGLNYKLMVWGKPLRPAPGKRFRQDTEYLVVAWKGTEADFVCNIDPADGPRYSTLHYQQRVTNFLEDSSGVRVNPYQKPIRLLKKVINMACSSKESLIVDVTCGTGTTAVSYHLNHQLHCISCDPFFNLMRLTRYMLSRRWLPATSRQNNISRLF